MEEEDVRERLARALEAFRGADVYLLENDLSERCIAARLALHLQSQFAADELVVDVEYNRDGNQVKRLSLPHQCQRLEHPTDDPVMVVPDIIVHKRGPNGPNVLVIEIKKTSNDEGHDCDRIRVHCFRAELRYEFGALIECETRHRHQYSMTVAEWIAGDDYVG